ncbi:MAG: hypothetical protein M3Y17_06640 [Actinomycetota bacterium]|nr:hypothetical protein [Actinomycetota bacterium]
MLGHRGTYTLTQTYETSDGNLSDNPHDGIRHADMTWMALSSTCAAGTCTVQFRRVLSDSTLETLTLSSNSPTGVFTGPIPGTDGDSTCVSGSNGPIKEHMLVRLSPPQQVGGQMVATMIQGRIFADYTCAGQPPVEDVATYQGQRQ